MKEQLIIKIILLLNHFLRTGIYESEFLRTYAIKEVSINEGHFSEIDTLKDWCQSLSERKCHSVYIESDGSEKFSVICEFPNYLERWNFSFDYDGHMWSIAFTFNNKELLTSTTIFDFTYQVSQFKRSLKSMVRTSETLYMSKWKGTFDRGLSMISSHEEKLTNFEKSFTRDERVVISALEELWIFGKVGSWLDLPKTKAEEVGCDEYEARTNKFREEYVRTLRTIMKK